MKSLHISRAWWINREVTLEIEADIPAGAPDHVDRIVTENGRTLKFSSRGLETE